MLDSFIYQSNNSKSLVVTEGSAIWRRQKQQCIFKRFFSYYSYPLIIYRNYTHSFQTRFGTCFKGNIKFDKRIKGGWETVKNSKFTWHLIMTVVRGHIKFKDVLKVFDSNLKWWLYMYLDLNGCQSLCVLVNRELVTKFPPGSRH